MIGLSQPPSLRPPGDGNRCGNETTLADPPGARTAVKIGARLHARIGFIASVSIIGLACKPRSGYQMCEFKVVRIPAKAWSKASEATPRKASGGGRCSLAATRERRLQLSRQPVDFKHEGGVWSAKEPFVEMPTARSRPPPSARPQPPRHWRDRHLLIAMAWSGASSKTAPRAGIAPALRGRPGFAARSPSGGRVAGRLEFRKSRRRGHLRGRALKDSCGPNFH